MDEFVGTRKLQNVRLSNPNVSLFTQSLYSIMCCTDGSHFGEYHNYLGADKALYTAPVSLK